MSSPMPEGLRITADHDEITPLANRLGQLLSTSHPCLERSDVITWLSDREQYPDRLLETAVLDGSGVVGYGAVILSEGVDTKEGEFCWLSVAPDYRHQGLGRLIISDRFTRAKCIPSVNVLVVKALTKENTLGPHYENIGFSPDPTEGSAYIWLRPKIVTPK